MKIPEFRVLLSQPTDEDPDATVEHVARILHGDKLRAELEAPKHGLNDMSAQAMHYTTLWIWSSLVRTHTVEDGFQAFKPRLLHAESVEGKPDVDPTQLGAPATG